eukprot:jgi/Psemu1/298461/fgenesh1_pm.580_\
MSHAIYINGAWVDSTNNNENSDNNNSNSNNNNSKNNNTIDVVDSNTGKAVATVPRGTRDDTLRAIAAAKAAFPNWSQQTTLAERKELLRRFLAAFGARSEEIHHRLTVELGCTLKVARTLQAGSLLYHVHTLLGLLENDDDNDNGNGDGERFEWEHAAGNCTVVKEPIGVVGAITPWNYPLNQIALKVFPALAAGCTVVLKPSEVTPLVAYSVAEAIHEAGFPEGVFNMVVGEGPECGEVLASHPDVSLVSFTGSTRAGQRLTEVAAGSGTLKPVRTELGGKSATLLLDDANVEEVVPAFVRQLTSNTGQSCNALSRMLVSPGHYEQVLSIASEIMESEVVGCSRTNPDATMGPLASKQQYDRVVSYIQTGIEEGARLVTGGPDPPEGTDANGYFVRPTLFADVTNQMTIAREEIFGPVLCVIPYETEEEGIRLANETPYGLNNAVASSDLKRALRVASRLESGMVMVNTTYVDGKAPFGGYKQSGNAREWGVYGLEEFLITKVHIIIVDVSRYE